MTEARLQIQALDEHDSRARTGRVIVEEWLRPTTSDALMDVSALGGRIHNFCFLKKINAMSIHTRQFFSGWKKKKGMPYQLMMW